MGPFFSLLGALDFIPVYRKFSVSCKDWKDSYHPMTIPAVKAIAEGAELRGGSLAQRPFTHPGLSGVPENWTVQADLLSLSSFHFQLP